MRAESNHQRRPTTLRLTRVIRALAAAIGLASVTAFGATACAKPPVLTDSLLERYNLAASDLRHVQLYTSEEIVLRRETTAHERSLSNAELHVNGGMRVEEIVIPSRTPCVALRTEGNFLLVGFVPNRPDLSLWFELDTKSEPSAQGRRYTLAPIANAPNERAPLVISRGFLVQYGGKKYRVADARSWASHLLVDLDESFARDRIRVQTPGWKLSEKPLVEGALSVSSPPPPAPADPSPFIPVSDAGASSAPARDAGVHP